MIIKIKNVGAVTNAEIDLKPLTVFLGKNNTGKTYVSYLLSGIFDGYSYNEYLNSVIAEEKLHKQYKEIDGLVSQVIESGNAKLDLNAFLEKEGFKYFEYISKRIPIWFPSFLGTQRRNFDDLEVIFNLKDLNKEILLKLKTVVMDSKISVNAQGDGLLNAHKDKDDMHIYFYSKDANVAEKLPIKVINQFIFRNVLMCIHRSIYPNVYVFGAERTGLTLFYKAMEIRKEEVDGKKEAREKNIISTPIGELIASITGMRREDNLLKRVKDAKRNIKIKKYMELSNILEHQVLGGHLDFSQSEFDKDREILFEWNFKKEIILDISVTSSVVKSLTPLVLYLRFAVQPSDLLVIDEPEMNLHPESQAKLIEFFCMLVNAGVNVILTTHSPFIVDHLVNLINASKRKNKKEIAQKFFLKDSDAFIKKEKVSVYLFENNTATSALDKKGIIDWDTFSKVSEEIADLYMDN